MDARLDTTRDAAGQTIRARFAEEQRLFRRASSAIVPEATTLATVTPRALVRLEGAAYSVWTRWAGLDLVVRVGANTVTIVRRDDTHVRHPRKRFGERSIDYRHYLIELARKPQAGRQVLPDLLRDLGAPFPAIWDRLHAAHGPREAARLSPRSSASSGARVPPSPSPPPRSPTRSPPARRCSSPSRRRVRRSAARRPTPSRHRPGASTWGAGARPTTMPGSASWRDERRPHSRSGRGASARLQAARHRTHVEGLARQARDAHWPHEDYLHEVLSAEQASRHEAVIRQRLHDARFPEVKTLDTFDFATAEGVSATQIHTLACGEWVTAPENLPDWHR